MKTFYALLLAAAGAPPALAAPADFASPLPYRSAFAAYQRNSEPEPAPDQYWRQANRDVAGSGHGMGHMGHTGTDHGKAAPGAAGHGTMDHSKMHHGSQDAATPPPARHQHKEH